MNLNIHIIKAQKNERVYFLKNWRKKVNNKQSLLLKNDYS